MPLEHHQAQFVSQVATAWPFAKSHFAVVVNCLVHFSRLGACIYKSRAKKYTVWALHVAHLHIQGTRFVPCCELHEVMGARKNYDLPPPLKVWTIFLMMETTACLSPGPAVLLVMSQGLSRGVLASMWSSCGILAANALYFAVSATGITAVLLGSKSLFNVITWVGAAYTIWLGVHTFASSGAAVSASASAPASSARMFTNGFVLQISKPGLLLFFVAVLPQFILPGRGVAGQVIILAVTSIFIEFVTLTLYGVLAAQVGKLGVGARFVTLANRLSGLMLILAAVVLARSRL